jgi:hypothetical protein
VMSSSLPRTTQVEPRRSQARSKCRCQGGLPGRRDRELRWHTPRPTAARRRARAGPRQGGAAHRVVGGARRRRPGRNCPPWPHEHTVRPRPSRNPFHIALRWRDHKS